MGLLSRFEGKMEDTVEGAADRMGAAPLSPVQIAKKAEKQMRREKMVGAGKQYAPTLYTVLVNADDDRRLLGYYPTLAGETETYLSAKAAESGLVMDGQPLVRFIVDDDLRHGKFDVIAEMVASPLVEQLRQEEYARYGILNQGGPAMMPDGVDAPVALDGGQLARRITDGINWQKEGIEPHGLRPGRGEGRAPRQNETLPRLQDAARRSSFKLGKKIREKSLRGQIDSKGTFHLRLSPEPRLRAAVGAVTRDAPARPCGCAVAKHEMRLYTVISSCAQQSHCSAARSIHTKGRSHAS